MNFRPQNNIENPSKIVKLKIVQPSVIRNPNIQNSLSTTKQNSQIAIQNKTYSNKEKDEEIKEKDEEYVINMKMNRQNCHNEFTKSDLKNFSAKILVPLISQDFEIYSAINFHWKYIIEVLFSQRALEISYVLLHFFGKYYYAISPKEYYFWNIENKLWCKESVEQMKNLRIPIMLEKIFSDILNILYNIGINNRSLLKSSSDLLTKVNQR